jgi:hypothetical protein
MGEIARYALARIPGEEATGALIETLGSAQGELKIGIANALGLRGSVDAAEALRGAVEDADPQVRVAALHALGQIPSADSAGGLWDRATGGSAQQQRAAREAYIRLADTRLGRGSVRGDICRHLYTGFAAVKTAAPGSQAWRGPGRPPARLLAAVREEEATSVAWRCALAGNRWRRRHGRILSRRTPVPSARGSQRYGRGRAATSAVPAHPHAGLNGRTCAGCDTQTLGRCGTPRRRPSSVSPQGATVRARRRAGYPGAMQPAR